MWKPMTIARWAENICRVLYLGVVVPFAADSWMQWILGEGFLSDGVRSDLLSVTLFLIPVFLIMMGTLYIDPCFLNVVFGIRVIHREETPILDVTEPILFEASNATGWLGSHLAWGGGLIKITLTPKRLLISSAIGLPGLCMKNIELCMIDHVGIVPCLLRLRGFNTGSKSIRLFLKTTDGTEDSAYWVLTMPDIEAFLDALNSCDIAVRSE